MISVHICINGVPIMARSAVRTQEPDALGKATYDVDDGTVIRHNPDKGAVSLAIELLKKIKEPVGQDTTREGEEK